MRLKLKTIERIHNDPSLVMTGQNIVTVKNKYGWIDLGYLQTGRHYIYSDLTNDNDYKYELRNGWNIAPEHVEEIIGD